MTSKTENASTFKTLAAVLALCLLGAALITWLQATNPAAGGSARSVLAGLSQAVVLHADQALGGDSQGLALLEADLERLAESRRGAAALSMPGGSGSWLNLEQHARAILAQRASIETIHAAAAFALERRPSLLAAAEQLLDHSASIVLIQDFQQRVARLPQALSELSGQVDAESAAALIALDLSFLRQLAEALSGANTELDVAPVDDTVREVTLVPLISELGEIEARVNEAVSAAPSLLGMQDHLNALSAIGAELLESQFSSAGSGGAGLLGQPWLPLGLLALALLILIALFVLHSRASVFERSSKEQSEQNERNQQAILRLLDELGSLADGDLTVEATVTEDITGAIADSINYAIEKLRELVATINETSIMVDSTAKQTANAASHMARAAENQGKEINAATESIVSMAGSIEQVSGNAERSSDVARHSVEVAHKGGEAVRRTIDGMNAIRETIQETSKRIKRLGESSQEIGNIVELINDIAEQTNILALNASIQASMAGEAGRGFAVVADEVQRLAERSTNATKQIEVLVRTIQADTNEAVVSMERSTTDVVGGALLAENAGAALDEIEQVSNQIASLVQNISGSSRQQANSAADVTKRTTRLREISDQAGKATTATAASISKLSQLASQLRQKVAGFTLPGTTSGERTLIESPLPPPIAAAPPPTVLPPLKEPAEPAEPGERAAG